MGAAMSNEMDQSDSWFESFEEEIASMTPQQQEPIPNPRPLPPEPPLMPTWLPILVYGAPSTVDIGPACWDGAPSTVDIGPACWDWAPPPVSIGPPCWDSIPLHVMLNEMDQSDSSSESSVTPQQQQPIPLHAMLIEIDQSDPSFESSVTLQQKQPIPNLSSSPHPPPRGRPPLPPVFPIPENVHNGNVNISRVVHTIRDIKPDVYTPKFVSIGPFHHGNERLQDMEMSKQVFFERFKQRSGVNLDDLNSSIESLVPQVRASYSENINLCDRGLVKLILVDAAFIIELFFYFHDDKVKEISTTDFPLSQLAILGTLPLDLVLFENQLPFFVLKELFDIAFPNNDPTFLELACDFFSNAFDLEMPKLDDHDNYKSVKHFTDLTRYLLLQRAPPTTMAPYVWSTDKLLYSANQLQELGLKFKVIKSKSILDIRFSDPILELPELLVADSMTDALFRNMVAFEQLHCSVTSWITNYVTLWSDLIDTEEDVHVLVEKKIIRSYVPHTEVVTLVRNMEKGGFQAKMLPEYIEIFKKLNEFYENRCHQHIASLKRDYCRTPWQVVASFAGGCLLILALLQTIFTIKK